MKIKQKVKNPLLIQINSHKWLANLSLREGKTMHLDDIPDEDIMRISQMGFDWVWLQNVWELCTSRYISNYFKSDIKIGYNKAHNSCTEVDGSPEYYLIRFIVSESLGGDEALAHFKWKLSKYGLKLLLDFIPSAEEISNKLDENNCITNEAWSSPLPYASRRHTYLYQQEFCLLAWPLSRSVDHQHRLTNIRFKNVLDKISKQSDGIGINIDSFVCRQEKDLPHNDSTIFSKYINHVKRQVPDYCFIAKLNEMDQYQVDLQDFTYTVNGTNHHLYANNMLIADNGNKCEETEFLCCINTTHKNLTKYFRSIHSNQEIATALLVYTLPGLRVFNDEQLDITHPLANGQTAADEKQKSIKRFYEDLLFLLRKPLMKNGKWRNISCKLIKNSNRSRSLLITYFWKADWGEMVWVTINFSPYKGTFRAEFPSLNLESSTKSLCDYFKSTHINIGKELMQSGLLFEIKPWEFYVFDVRRLKHE